MILIFHNLERKFRNSKRVELRKIHQLCSSSGRGSLCSDVADQSIFLPADRSLRCDDYLQQRYRFSLRFQSIPLIV